jgi:hypothetical protein
MKTHKNAETISFRIAAVTEHIARSSFSPNRETYLVYLVNKTKPFTVAKVVFRYLEFEDGLSEEFADFRFVHRFKGKRDRSCDESWQSFSTKMVIERDGRLSPTLTARFVSADAVQEIAADQS